MTLLCGSCGHLYRSKPTRIPVGRACRFYDPRESKINRRQLKVKIVNPKRVACSNFTPTKNIFCELSKSDVQMDPLVCNHRRQNYDKYKGWNDCRKCGQFDKEVLPLFEEGYLKAPSKKIRRRTKRQKKTTEYLFVRRIKKVKKKMTYADPNARHEGLYRYLMPGVSQRIVQQVSYMDQENLLLLLLFFL